MPQLLGPDGQPIDTLRLTKEEATPELTGIRQILSAHPSVGLTPDRIAVLMREAEQGNAMRYLELAEDMEEKDLRYLAVLGTRKRQVAQLDFTIESASDDPADEANAQMLRDLFNRFDVEDVIFDMLDAVGKGFSVHEILWDMSEKQWEPTKLVYRDPRWFGFDRVGGTELMLRVDVAFAGNDTPRDQVLPVNIGLQRLTPYKYIVHTHKAKSGLPIRGGLARAAVWSWMFKNYGLKDWVTFAEVYGMPLRIGKYASGASADEKAALRRAVAEMGTDASCIIPTSMQIEFVEKSAKGDGSAVFKELCDYCDQNMTIAVLGQNSTTQATPGSHAIGRTQNDVRGDIERSDAKQVAAAINRALVRPYIDLNRGPQTSYPSVRIGRAESIDLTAVSQALGTLVPLGLKVSQSELRAKMGFSDPADDTDLLQPKPTAPVVVPGPPGASANPVPPAPDNGDETADDPQSKGTTGLARNAVQPGAAPRDMVDVITDKVAQLAGPSQDAMLAVIRKLVEDAGSLQDVADGLARIFPSLKADQLANAMRQAMALADVAGRADLVGDQTPSA